MISVIVPVYNIEPYIEKCIKSILAQTYDNLEIIVVNDGSTDNSFNICSKLAVNEPRIRVIDQKNAGLSEARNAGLRIARGSYIAFVDGDDYIDEQMYEKLYERLMQDQSDLALCNIRYVDEMGQELDKDRFDLKDEILCENDFWKGYYGSLQIPYVVAWNKLYKRKIFKDITFDKGKIHEDEFILHKVISQCDRISAIKNPFYNYRQRSESIMNSSYSVQRLQVIEAYHLRINYFEQKRIDYIGSNILRILSELLVAQEKLDLSVAENGAKYKEAKYLYKIYFKHYFRKLNTKLIIKSLLFLYCGSVLKWLRWEKRKRVEMAMKIRGRNGNVQK